jgi:membrane protease YdiL (CAAX protease family)
MTLPGVPSLVFLAYILLFLPWAALRSAKQLGAEGNRPRTPKAREAIWIGTMISLAVLLALAWFVGRSFDYPFFATPQWEPKHFVAAVAVLAVCFGIRPIAKLMWTEEERKKLAVYAWAPRSRREWALWTATVLLGSFTEEVAYRGVGMSILWYTLGNPWIAAGIAAIGFALGHSTQGWKSMVVVFVFALLMHALVAYTGTLVLAIAVHTIYNLTTGYDLSRDAKKYDAEAVAA